MASFLFLPPCQLNKADEDQGLWLGIKADEHTNSFNMMVIEIFWISKPYVDARRFKQDKLQTSQSRPRMLKQIPLDKKMKSRPIIIIIVALDIIVKATMCPVYTSLFSLLF
jgi:hypothetical protein